jgi:glycosyltransferase involved in cell wall biosynthesis
MATLRIAYWTSGFEPEMEAISAEVATLRRRFPSSVAWGLSHRHWALISRRRGYCLHPRAHLLFRAATWLFEPLFHLNHIVGSIGDWFYLNGVSCRPTVLTLAAACESVSAELLGKVSRFVIESPADRRRLNDLGISDERIQWILPPVDIERFAPTNPPDGRFTVLFASSPEEPSWLEARGVPLILDAASLRPQMHFRLLWRPWGRSLATVQQWICDRGLRNVELAVGRVTDMATEYARSHVTIAPFADYARSKPAPNSIMESLACGRPVLVTETVGLADMVTEARAGLVSPASGEAIAEHLDGFEREWWSFARNSRALAERSFGIERFITAYEILYAKVLMN